MLTRRRRLTVRRSRMRWFLRAALAEGERPASDVLTEATTLGIAEMTLRRARKALGVNVRRQGFGTDGRFLLALPSNGSDAADGARKPNGGVGNGNGLDHEKPLAPPGFSVSYCRHPWTTYAAGGGYSVTTNSRSNTLSVSGCTVLGCTARR